MTAYLAPQFDTQFFDGSTVAAGYKLYTYDSGTTTPKAVYSDQAGTVPHTNPIVLDANGRVAGQMFLGSGEYTFTLKTDADVLVKTWNDVAGSGTANEAAANDAAIRADLASTSSDSKGAGMAGHSDSLTYPAGTVGGKLSRVAQDPNNPAKSIRLQGGAIRRDSGAWAPITTSGHTPLGITTVEELDAYTLRVHYNGDNTDVGTLISAVDKELAPYAIIGGCSCSANYADFSFYAPVIVDLQNNTTPSVAPWLASYVTLNTSGTYATIINHPPRALNVDPPGVTLLNRVVGAGRIPSITWGTNTTTISTKGTLGALVSRTGSSTFSVSNQATAGTVSTSWIAGALTITHPDCGSYSTPMVCSHNSAYRAEILNYSATTIVVQFRNAAGTVVGPSDDAEMKLLFERSNALFDTPMPSGFSARVDLGYLAVPLAAIQNISLNNLWLIGAMFKS